MSRLFSFVALALCMSAAYSQGFATLFNSIEVAPGIYVLEGADGFGGGSVTLLVGDEHVILIDDVMVPTAPALFDAANELAGRPIDFVINTHVHGDHVGGNALAAEAGTTVVAHDNIRKRLLEKPDDAGGEGGLPTLTFSDSVTFHVNSHTAHVIHAPHAHTDGDALIHFQDANVVHAGDLFFSQAFPFIDLDSGGSVAGFKAIQRRILAMANDETIIIAGHGKLVSDKADLQAALDMLIDAEGLVEALVLEGMTEEEVVAANPLAGYHDTWNWGFITTEIMTKSLYRSLTAE